MCFATPLHQAEAERQERQRQRLATLAAAEDKKRTEQAAITDADVEVAPRVEAWAKAAGVVRKVKKGTKPPNYRLVMRALLVTLHKVGVVCHAAPKPRTSPLTRTTPCQLPNLTVPTTELPATPTNGAIKKAYFKVCVFVSPSEVCGVASTRVSTEVVGFGVATDCSQGAP